MIKPSITDSKKSHFKFDHPFPKNNYNVELFAKFKLITELSLQGELDHYFLFVDNLYIFLFDMAIKFEYIKIHKWFFCHKISWKLENYSNNWPNETRWISWNKLEKLTMNKTIIKNLLELLTMTRTISPLILVHLFNC